MAGFQIHFRDPLVGHRVAGGIQAHGFPVRVCPAGEQRRGLNHVGMTAHDHIEAHVAKLLGDLLLFGAGGGLVFIAPVDEHHGGLRPLGLHLRQALVHFLIEGIQLAGHKGIHQKRAGVGQGIPVHVHLSGGGILRQALVGVVHHTDFDAVHFLHHILWLGYLRPGAQHLQPLVPHGTHGAQEAIFAGIVAVVVGGEQQVKAGVFQGIHNFVRAVEGGMTGILVALVGACQGGFQVGHRQVGSGCVGVQILENGIKIVAAVAAQTGVDHGHVHQHISGDGN